jgi:hypothetical protein
MQPDFAAVYPRRFLHWLSLAASVLLVQFFANAVWAASISAVQGEKVLMELGTDSATEGDLFIAMSPEGKKLGVLRIQKVRGNKALAQVVKGRAEKGWSAVARGSAATKPHKAAPVKQEVVTKTDLRIGGLVGYSMINQNVSVLGTAVSMTGNGFNGGLLGDYFFNDSLGVRAIATIENFDAQQTITTTSCTHVNTCETKIMYGNLGALARWTFVPGTAGLWIGAGAYLMYPFSKSSNAIDDTTTITMTYVLTAALGADIQIGDGMFIPLQVEYGMFPTTSDVTTNWIVFRGGFGMSF